MSTETTPDSFVITHCQRCAAGWTRTSSDGQKLIVCLLDRQTVWKDMAACNRFEAMLAATT